MSLITIIQFLLIYALEPTLIWPINCTFSSTIAEREIFTVFSPGYDDFSIEPRMEKHFYFWARYFVNQLYEIVWQLSIDKNKSIYLILENPVRWAGSELIGFAY